MINMKHVTIDITKPPFPPPVREFTFFNRETAKSKRLTEEWKQYMIAYNEAINKEHEND